MGGKKMNEVIARLDWQAVLIIEFLMYLFFGVGLSFVIITIYRLFKDWVRGR
jgi:hypothetical protein